MTSDQVSPKSLARLVEEMRRKRPLVQCVTNFVSMDVTANALLALGASPAMVHAPEESCEFLALADALVCNIGTLSHDWVESMETVAMAAAKKGRPWVLDPVGVGATQFRNAAVEGLLRCKPTVVRGNASEILAIGKNCGLTDQAARAKGVDSLEKAEDLVAIAKALAEQNRCVIAMTGPIDVVTDGRRSVKLSNGSALMTRVTALGCALSAVVAAFLAVADDPFEGTVAALAVYGVAGDIAAEAASRPGSYRMAFLDALDSLGGEDLERAKIQ